MLSVGIVAKNLEETIHFYEILGLSFEQVGGPNHFESVDSKGVKLMLDSEDLIKKLYPEWQRVQSQNVSLAFEQSEAKKVDATFQKLIDQGGVAIKKPFDAFWGQRYACVYDPNGNQIDIYANL